MTKQQIENDLEQARREAAALVNHPDYLRFVSLVRQFERLDAAEQKAKASGKMGGRPPDKNPSVAAQRKRDQRALAKAEADQAKAASPAPVIAPWCDSCEILYSESRKSTTMRGGYNVCDDCAADWDEGEAKKTKKKKGGKK